MKLSRWTSLAGYLFAGAVIALQLGGAGLAATTVVPLNKEILGQQQVETLPPRPVNVHVSEGVLSADAIAITHSHAMGWTYVVQGAHILMVADRKDTYQQGQAVWIAEGTEHTHDWERSQTNKFWFIGIGTNQPPTVPQGFRLLAVTDPLQGLGTGSHLIQLVRYTQSPGPPGGVVGTGFGDTKSPKVLIGLSGTAGISEDNPLVISQKVGPERVLLLQPRPAGHLMRNVEGQPYSVLVLLVTPTQ